MYLNLFNCLCKFKKVSQVLTSLTRLKLAIFGIQDCDGTRNKICKWKIRIKHIFATVYFMERLILCLEAK